MALKGVFSIKDPSVFTEFSSLTEQTALQEGRTPPESVPRPPYGLRFSILHRAFKRKIDDRVADMGLTGVQCEVLANLCRLERTHAEVCQRDLERMSRVTHPTMTEILCRLEKKGFVCCRAGTVDRRAKIVCSTARCRTFHDAIHMADAEVFSALCRGLSQQQMEAFFAITDRMLENSAELMRHEQAESSEGVCATRRKE